MKSDMDSRQKRKSLRLKCYDYSAPGVYFITVCTENRRKILGNLVGHDACDVPQIELFSYGKTLEKCIMLMSENMNISELTGMLLCQTIFICCSG